MRIRQKSLSFLCMASIALSGCASTGNGAPPVAAAPVAPQGPALWKVADEDTTIYLFGTVHALPKDVEWYRGPIAEALASSQTLVTEISKGAMSDPTAQRQTVAMAMLPANQNLRTMLSDEQRIRYEAQLTKLGLPLEAFDHFEPWFAGLTLSILPLLAAGFSPDSGVEAVIDTKAGAEKTRDQLETVAFQLGLFDNLSQQQQIDFLMSTVDGGDQTVAVMNAMVGEWAAGDADGLATIMNEQLTDTNLADVLLYSRNRNWAQWIDDRLDKPGTVFIAVGAGHLAGTNSVQNYLNQRGIVTARVQ